MKSDQAVSFVSCINTIKSLKSLEQFNQVIIFMEENLILIRDSKTIF